MIRISVHLLKNQCSNSTTCRLRPVVMNTFNLEYINFILNLDMVALGECRWTKSNWAFLNEPPVMEAPTSKYASQYHVANLASSKLNTGHGISA